MEKYNYHREQLAKVQPGKAGTYAATVQIRHETGNTKWMDLHKESATELVNFLMTHYEIEPIKTHVLKVSRLPWTEKKQERIKIKSELFEQSVTFNKDLANKVYDNNRSEAIAWLKAKGFNIIGYGEGDNNSTYIITDTFKSLK